MAPPGTDFIMVYMPSPPELEESINVCRAFCLFDDEKIREREKKRYKKYVVISKVITKVSVFLFGSKRWLLRNTHLAD